MYARTYYIYIYYYFRWHKKFDIFKMDKVFCPINIKNTHWALCVIYMHEKRVQVLSFAVFFDISFMLTHIFFVLLLFAVLRLHG